jgi:hypothetical protein
MIGLEANLRRETQLSAGAGPIEAWSLLAKKVNRLLDMSGKGEPIADVNLLSLSNLDGATERKWMQYSVVFASATVAAAG